MIWYIDRHDHAVTLKKPPTKTPFSTNPSMGETTVPTIWLAEARSVPTVVLTLDSTGHIAYGRGKRKPKRDNALNGGLVQAKDKPRQSRNYDAKVSIHSGVSTNHDWCTKNIAIQAGHSPVDTLARAVSGGGAAESRLWWGRAHWPPGLGRLGWGGREEEGGEEEGWGCMINVTHFNWCEYY